MEVVLVLVEKLLKSMLKICALFVITMLCAISLIVQPVFVSYGSKKPLANPNNLKEHVIMLSEKLPERSDDTDKLEKSAEYIYSELSKYTDSVIFQEYTVWGIPYRNIVAEFSSANDCGVYVIGAHYDAFDGLPGADDNASGVAGLIELARIFSKSTIPCNLLFVAYALEEPPYFRSNDMGSYYHAKTLMESGAKVELMISLEMIGYYSDMPKSQKYPIQWMEYLYSDKGNFISIVGNTDQIGVTRFYKKEMRKTGKMPVYSMNAPSILAGIDFSDHLNYWLFNYPAIMITDTAFYRNKNYHTKDDTAEKLDYERMRMVVDGIYYSTHEHMNQ